MFVESTICPVCNSMWHAHDDSCSVCGSIAEIYFERPLPELSQVDEDMVQRCIARSRARIAKNKNDGIAHYTLALSYINLGLLKEGMTELARAVALLPESDVVAYEAAAIAVTQGDVGDGVQREIDRIISRRPDFKEAIFLRGIVLQRSGKADEAVKAWQEAYTLDQTYAPAKRRLEAYIWINRILLTNSKVLDYLRTMALPNKERSYLKLLNWKGPERPQESTQRGGLFRIIAPSLAERRREVYAAQLQDHRELEKEFFRLTQAMEADVLGLSNLCLRARTANPELSRSVFESQSAATRSDGRPLSNEERAAVLDLQVQKMLRAEYQLKSYTDITAHGSKFRDGNCITEAFLFIISMITVVGLILYIPYLISTLQKQHVFLEVDEYGNVKKYFGKKDI